MNLIGLIDVGIGNIGSLNGAIYELGFDVCLVDTPYQMEKCDSIILPGVGSFYHGMKCLESHSLLEPIRIHVSKKKPLLGICLGMQLLFESGSEGEKEKNGVGLLPGAVKLLTGEMLPHVGWNEVDILQQHPVWKGVKAGVEFYFVHSYRVECNPEYIYGRTEYGELFPSVVSCKNVVGMQFHPEKSQKNGLRMLENFCFWDGKC